MAGISLLALLWLIAPLRAAAAPFVSDDFNTASLSQEWTVADTVGDGTVAVTGAGTGDAALELSVPAGVSHNPWGSTARFGSSRTSMTRTSRSRPRSRPRRRPSTRCRA